MDMKIIKNIANPLMLKDALKLILFQRPMKEWLNSLPLKTVSTFKTRELRDKTIKSLKRKGIKVSNSEGTFCTKNLSKSCINCMKGQHVNYLISTLCNKRCPFCYQERLAIKGGPTIEKQTIINKSKIIKLDKVKSFSITGGEPLLHLKDVVDLLKRIKTQFGKSCWTHIYTNGTLLNHHVLKKLKDAGLDEIRIDIAANNYNLKHIKIAGEYFKNVVVEIPVIPEDEERIKGVMRKLDRLGVSCLNLNEFLFFGANLAFYKRRRYALKIENNIKPYDRNEIPVYGSEEVAFRLLEYAKLNKIKMSIHYCSFKAKRDIQHRRIRYRLAIKSRRPYEKLLRKGFYEKAVVYAPDIFMALRDLKKNKVPQKEIYISKMKKRLETHPKNIKYLHPDKYEIAIVQSFLNRVDLDLKLIRTEKNREQHLVKIVKAEL